MDLRLLGRDRRRRRRALRAAGRHHQPERVRADQLDRGRHLGRGRRPRHALRRRRRRGARQLREDLLHRRAAGGVALRTRRAVRAGHALPAARRWSVCCRPRRAPNEPTGIAPVDARRTSAWVPRRRMLRVRDARRGCAAADGARQDALPGEPDGQLRRLQGARRPDAVRRSRRAALHHRTERRRQDDDDGRDHRQDAAGRRDRPGSDRASTCWRSVGTARSRRPASAGSSRSRRCSST